MQLGAPTHLDRQTRVEFWVMSNAAISGCLFLVTYLGNYCDLSATNQLVHSGHVDTLSTTAPAIYETKLNVVWCLLFPSVICTLLALRVSTLVCTIKYCITTPCNHESLCLRHSTSCKVTQLYIYIYIYMHLQIAAMEKAIDHDLGFHSAGSGVWDSAGCPVFKFEGRQQHCHIFLPDNCHTTYTVG